MSKPTRSDLNTSGSDIQSLLSIIPNLSKSINSFNSGHIQQICDGCKLPKKIYSNRRCQYCCMKLIRKRSKIKSSTEEQPFTPIEPVAELRKCRICLFEITNELVCKEKPKYCSFCFGNLGKVARICVVCRELCESYYQARCFDCYQKFEKETAKSVESPKTSAIEEQKCTICKFVISPENTSGEDPEYCKTCYSNRGNRHRNCIVCGSYQHHQGHARCNTCYHTYKTELSNTNGPTCDSSKRQSKLETMSGLSDRASRKLKKDPTSRIPITNCRKCNVSLSNSNKSIFRRNCRTCNAKTFKTHHQRSDKTAVFKQRSLKKGPILNLPVKLRRCELCDALIRPSKETPKSKVICRSCVSSQKLKLRKCADCSGLATKFTRNLCHYCYRRHQILAEKLGISIYDHILKTRKNCEQPESDTENEYSSPTKKCQFCFDLIKRDNECAKTPLVCNQCFNAHKQELRVCMGCDNLCKYFNGGYCRTCWDKQGVSISH